MLIIPSMMHRASAFRPSSAPGASRVSLIHGRENGGRVLAFPCLNISRSELNFRGISLARATSLIVATTCNRSLLALLSVIRPSTIKSASHTRNFIRSEVVISAMSRLPTVLMKFAKAFFAGVFPAPDLIIAFADDAVLGDFPKL